MKLSIKILTLLVLFTLLLLPTGSVQAQGPNPGEGKVIFGSNFTLESDDTLDGDLVVFGGNVTIEEDATLNGDLVVMGGMITSNGEMNGDVVVVGGQVSLEESALVTGDVVTIGGQLEKAEGARINGDVVNNVAPDILLPDGKIPPTVPDAPVVPDVPGPNFNIGYNPFGQIFGVFFWAVIVAAFSMLISLFWQPQIERTGRAIISQPLMVGAIGLLSVVAAILLILTILPVFAIALAWLFGIVAMGMEVGERFKKAINQEWTPVLTVGFGTFLLMLVGGAIGLVPCLGGLILFLLGLLGIGGSVITVFGTRSPQVPALTVSAPSAGSGQTPDQIPPAS